jgi:hypothetical protein
VQVEVDASATIVITDEPFMRATFNLIQFESIEVK